MNHSDTSLTLMPTPLSSRQERVGTSTSGVFDIIVVGGGIHGTCVAKLAAKAGFRTLLLEARDYASATSSRSSKMAHGGLRYLEMYDFKQVFEGIKAREELFEACPNLVRPEAFLIPIGVGESLFSYKLRCGLFLYDLMVRNRERAHRWIPREQLSFHSFHANRHDLAGCYQYTDGLMNDSRLVFEMVLSAQQYGAVTLNYAFVEKIQRDPRNLLNVTWRDEIAAGTHQATGSVVINCTGPWAPEIREVSDQTARCGIKYSRGSHLVFSVPWKDPSLFLPLEERGRYYFVWPHATGTLVGTTEREVSESELDPQPTADEVDEILQRLERDLPESGLNRSTLHYGFAGIRTLPLRDARRGVSKLSRKHIWRSSRGVITLLGGKYTTFAWTSGEGLKLAMRELGREAELPSALDDLPSIAAGSLDALREEFATKYGKTGPAVERALSRLGGMCRRYRDRVDAWAEISPGVLRLEAIHAVEVEHAETIDDVIRRRLDLEFLPSHGIEALDDVCRILAQTHGVDSLEEQRVAWKTRLRDLHAALGIEN
jgi:glycerol-3-phosphate dehydrogenase